MMFDSPQWSIRIDHGGKEDTYCGIVSNVLDIVISDTRTKSVVIRVPSGLFPLLEYLKISKDTGVVQLFVEKYNGRWYFGFDQGEGTPVYNLWTYTENKLPKCISHKI